MWIKMTYNCDFVAMSLCQQNEWILTPREGMKRVWKWLMSGKVVHNFRWLSRWCQLYIDGGIGWKDGIGSDKVYLVARMDFDSTKPQRICQSGGRLGMWWRIINGNLIGIGFLLMVALDEKMAVEVVTFVSWWQDLWWMRCTVHAQFCHWKHAYLQCRPPVKKSGGKEGID